MYETIRDLLINEMNIDESLLKPEATLTGDLGLNSLELADLIVMCEERFGVVFEDDDLANLQTIGDVAAYVEERK
ncbi:MAG: acyl carrier protein [Clostridia bacterium]|nr:acyl carrier protein [Clostridia bacterium]